MQIAYLCRYTRAHTCTPSKSFQCFLAPSITQWAQKAWCTCQDFLGIQASQYKSGSHQAQEEPLLK